MKIDKAIKILKHYEPHLNYFDHPDLKDAINLGIQALIFAQNVLKLMPIVFSLPLPGEIKD